MRSSTSSRHSRCLWLLFLPLLVEQRSFTVPRRSLLSQIIASAATAAPILPTRAEDIAVFRTLKEAPEIPKVLAVMLLRTTYDAAEGWGAFRTMTDYQVNFAKQLSGGFQSFKGRYENYDLRELYNTSKLLQSRSGGVTNRFYFSFLNDAQWRVIGREIRRPSDQQRFSRVVGDGLYRAILSGVELKADVADDQVPEGEESEFNRIGTWPRVEPLPKAADPASLVRGGRQLLGYLKDRGYCRAFEVSDLVENTDGSFSFLSFVDDPINIDATASLMRSNNNFAPRYDQRILQAYFADRGFSAVLSDNLAQDLNDGFSEKDRDRRKIPRGIRTVWKLAPDPDAAL